MNRAFVAVMVAPCVGQPAQAQTLVDTFKQLRQNIHQLGSARPQPAQGLSAGSAVRPAQEARAVGLVTDTELRNDVTESDLGASPIIKGDVDTFDIVGLKLGMSSGEIQRVASRLGFTLQPGGRTTSGTFEVEATRRANEMMSRPVAATSSPVFRAAVGHVADGSALNVMAALEPTGPKVSSVWYSTKLNGQTRSDAIASLVGKFGPWSTQEVVGADYGHWRWCGRRRACDNGTDDVLDVTVDHGEAAFSLKRSVGYLNRTEDRLKARAQQIAGAHGGGMKF